MKYFGAHRPFSKGKSRPDWKDGSGRTVPHRFLIAANPRRLRRFPARGARDFATLNHYALRSLDSYIVKNDRGDVNRENRIFDDSYWRERNDPAWEDKSIQQYMPALKRSLEALKADKEIKKLHDEAVKSHITKRNALMTKRNALMTKPEYVEMYAQLRTASTLPPQEEAMLIELGLMEAAI